MRPKLMTASVVALMILISMAHADAEQLRWRAYLTVDAIEGEVQDIAIGDQFVANFEVESSLLEMPDGVQDGRFITFDLTIGEVNWNESQPHSSPQFLLSSGGIDAFFVKLTDTLPAHPDLSFFLPESPASWKVKDENDLTGKPIFGGDFSGTYTVAPVPDCEGDFDLDGDVDGSDLAVFAADFGRTDCSGDCEGDFDDDGDVDGSDLAVFAADFGRTDCPLAGVLIDLRADVNRDGIVDLNDPTDDENEDTWDSDHGAIFLANMDDDQNVCPLTGTDENLAACHDASDNMVNGPDDLLDMARLLVAPSPLVSAEVTAILSADSIGAGYIRVFKNNNGTFELFTLPGSLSQEDLQSGVEFAIEAKDFVRDRDTWNGFVDLTLTVNSGGGPTGPLLDGSDIVRMRVAPVIFHHNLQPVETPYATELEFQASIDFRTDLTAACSAAGILNPLHTFNDISDQWTQDFFETAYMVMPGENGPHFMNINFRSANYTGGILRDAGRVVFTDLRGPDVAGAVQYDPGHTDGMDTLNSFGNFSMIPPYSHDGRQWPFGRVIRGGGSATWYPDRVFDKMVCSQGIQADCAGDNILYINTRNFLVGHVNETINFIKVDSTRGWAALVADPWLGWSMLVEKSNQGYGDTVMFAGTSWETTINGVLGDMDIANANAWAITVIDEQILQLKSATGLTDEEIIKVPALFWEQYGYLASYLPSMTNGFVLADTHYAAPDPHGPVIDSGDIFKKQFSDTMSAHGITVHWIENWVLYHVLDGSVGEGVNATRELPDTYQWWE